MLNENSKKEPSLEELTNLEPDSGVFVSEKNPDKESNDTNPQP